MHTIIVTGSPGTGKTTIAKFVAKSLGYKYIDVNQIIKEKKLDTEYDKKRDCFVIDEKKLAKELEKTVKNSKKDLVIDSHMSHFLDKKYVDLCIITTCELKTLKKRLEKRGDYSKEKVRENIDAEIFENCFVEAQEHGHNIIKVDTTKKKTKEIIKQIRGKL